MSRVRIAKRTVEITREEHKTSKITIRNADSEPRQVIVEYPAEEGWKLSPGTQQLEETTEFITAFECRWAAGKRPS